MKYLFAVLVCTFPAAFSLYAYAGEVESIANDQFKIMAFNAEWLWDHKEPHDGNVCEKRLHCIPSKKEYKERITAITNNIENFGASIVGLSEIENKAVAEDIQKELGNSWGLAFMKGRDTFTGQDVALLVKKPFLIKEMTTFKNIYGSEGNVTKRPSKVLGVRLERALNCQTKNYYIIVIHLLSRRSNHDDQRAAQADAIRAAILQTIEQDSIDHFIVLGDFNDYRNSPVLKRIRGLDDEKCPHLKQFAKDNEDIYSYTYNGRDQLIDHILIDDSLDSIFTVAKPVLSKSGNSISDHRSVLLSVKETNKKMCQ